MTIKEEKTDINPLKLIKTQIVQCQKVGLQPAAAGVSEGRFIACSGPYFSLCTEVEFPSQHRQYLSIIIISIISIISIIIIIIISIIIIITVHHHYHYQHHHHHKPWRLRCSCGKSCRNSIEYLKTTSHHDAIDCCYRAHLQQLVLQSTLRSARSIDSLASSSDCVFFVSLCYLTMSTKKTSLLKKIRSNYAFATILKVNCVPTFLTHFRKLFFENNPKLFRVLLQRCHINLKFKIKYIYLIL